MVEDIPFVQSVLYKSPYSGCGSFSGFGVKPAVAPPAPPGIQGPPGPQGPPGETGQGYTWRGTWTASTAYYPYDTVAFGGSSYVCIGANTNSAPPSSYWNLMAEEGAAGAPGEPGTSAAWRGAWNATTTYNIDDGVSYQGSSYVAIATNTNVPPPDPTHWQMIAQEGATGPAGPAGTRWWNGTGAPTPPPTGSNPGDYYLDDSTGDVWIL
jgi:hypothetical protein